MVVASDKKEVKNLDIALTDLLDVFVIINGRGLNRFLSSSNELLAESLTRPQVKNVFRVL